MGLFDSLQQIISEVTDGSIAQNIEEKITGVTDGASETVTTVTEEGQTIIDDLTKH